ncbi:MAG: hypothetical protein ACTHK2_19100 [Dokdonella sp.]|uniref:hypothetical protein n=1 Tax=Dokdonella sp. TaxID=2291710 RepID=UPI003F802EB3
MNASVLPNGSWTVVATVEVAAGDAVNRFLPRQTSEYAFRAAPSSPAGYVWIDIYVDFGLGIEHAARIARSILRELEACGLPDFRIVAGDAYLALSEGAVSA